MGPGAPGGGGGGGGREAGGAGLWSGSTGPTGPGSAEATSVALPCRRRSGNTNRMRCSQNTNCAKGDEREEKKKQAGDRLNVWGREMKQKNMKCDSKKAEKMKGEQKNNQLPSLHLL